MAKKRLNLEYPLKGRQPDLLWQLMSTDHGLERWLADQVVEDDGVMSLTWGSPFGAHHTLRANIVERRKNSHIRFQWVDEEDLGTTRVEFSVTSRYEIYMQVVFQSYVDDSRDLVGVSVFSIGSDGTFFELENNKLNHGAE